MSDAEHHVMHAVLIEDRATMRYSCPICQRCVDDGPEGITIVHRGDQRATHRGGKLMGIEQEVEQTPRSRAPLH